MTTDGARTTHPHPGARDAVDDLGARDGLAVEWQPAADPVG